MATASFPSPSGTHAPTSSRSPLQCCCGRRDCALLKRNCSVLETVEKDVQTAAQLGQALLVRHEAYMVDAERDRLELTSKIERLEMSKLELEAENTLKIEENRNLLDQLEILNSTVSDSDVKIRCLEASLLSSQQAVRRLENAVQRAEDMERHLAIMEEEQDALHNELRSSREDARSHAQRFKEAQRGIHDMQDQLERIENEAKEERERHQEVVGRMERQREIEKQLDTAAGRLKGAAAVKGAHGSKNGGPIVGHFVRDLLQDNANLQLGIAELREMLMNSNDEIQSLREQVMFHQPVSEDEPNRSSTSTLKGELDSKEGPTLSQELHIHHHYHASPKRETKKPKRKKTGLTPGHFTPSVWSLPSTPTASHPWDHMHSPTAPALLAPSSHVAKPTLSMPPPQQWSTLSNPSSDVASSVPSSPRSNPRNSLFDQGFNDNELSSPTTSFDPMSPTWRVSAHTKRPSETSFLSLSAISVMEVDECLPSMNHSNNTIHEEDEDQESQQGNAEPLGVPQLTKDAPSIEDSAESSDFSHDMDDYLSRPRLHRAVSHESIMSLTGGLDIHTLKSRPSQMTLRPLGATEAIVTGVIAQPILSRGSTKRSDIALRDHFAIAGRSSSRAVSNPARPANGSPSGSLSSESTTVGSRGKWATWRPWAAAASTSSSSSGLPETQNMSYNIPVDTSEGARSGIAPAQAQTKSPPRDIVVKSLNRSTGINQAGSIPGFQAYWAMHNRKGAPAKVNPERVDTNALLEGLHE